jgi:hypothetical protein
LCTGINNRGQIACSVNDASGITTLGLFIGSPEHDFEEDSSLTK